MQPGAFAVSYTGTPPNTAPANTKPVDPVDKTDTNSPAAPTRGGTRSAPLAERPDSSTHTRSPKNPVHPKATQLRTGYVTHRTEYRGLNFLQGNLARSQVSTHEASMLATDLHIDIMLLQEPYAVSNIPVRFNLTHKIISANGPDAYPWAAIIIINPDLRVTNIRQAGNEYLTLAHIASDNSDLYVASIYMKYSEDPGIILDVLGKAIRMIGGASIIIAADTNAASITWGAEQTNPRGEIVEEFANIHGLKVINGPDQPPTFATNRAQGYLDVTGAKGRIARAITN